MRCLRCPVLAHLLATVCTILLTVTCGNCAEELAVQLGKAVAKGNVAKVKALLADGADPNRRIPDSHLDYTPLFIAVKEGHENVAKVLLDAGADPRIEDENGDPVMVYAADAGREACAKLLIEHGIGIDSTNSIGVTALMRGLNYEKTDDIRAKLDLGANPNQRTASGQTALMVAAEAGNTNAVNELLRAGVNVNDRDRSGATALMVVAGHYHAYPGIAKILLKAGSDINAKDKTGRTAPMMAVGNNHWEKKDRLLFVEARPDPKIVDENGETLLSEAVEADLGLKVVADLIDRGANPSVVTKKGVDLIMFAADNANTNVLGLLLGKGGAVTRADEYGYTAAHRAAMRGPDAYRQNTEAKRKKYNAATLATLKLLAAHDASLTAAAKNGATPLHVAARNGVPSTVRFVLTKYKNPDIQDDEGVTALHLAAHRQDKTVFEQLLAAGAKINSADKQGKTVLHAAIEKDNSEDMAYFLTHGANIKKLGDLDGLLLQKARIFHDKAVLPKTYAQLITLLSENAQNVEKRDNEGMTPLMWIAASSNSDALEALLKCKPNLNASSKDGRTAMMWAASAIAEESMTLLAKAGADDSIRDKRGRTAMDWFKWAKTKEKPNARSASDVADRILKSHREALSKYLKLKKWNPNDRMFGTSPLHLAASFGDTNAVTLLLSRGANVNLRIEDGTTPLIEAAANGQIPVIDLLMKNGAEIGWRDNDRQRALDKALSYAHFDAVRALITYKGAIEGNENDLLHAAVRHMDGDFLREILKAGVSCATITPDNDPFSNGRTYSPVFYAASLPDTGILKILREFPKATGYEIPGQLERALHNAADKGRLANVKYLIEKVKVDKDVLLSDRFGGVTRVLGSDERDGIEMRYSALSKALENGHTNTVNYLIDKGVKVVGRTRCGAPPVTFVVIHKKTDLLCRFLKKGASTEAIDFDKRTPLHHAAERNDSASIALLLKHGANRSAKDKDGAIPLDLARKAKAKEAISLLSSE